MIIYKPDKTKLLDIDVDDTSYRYRAIRQASKVYLYYSLTEHVEIPVGSYINYQGQTYTLWSPEGFTKHGKRNLEYTVEFGDYTELLNRTRYKFISGTARKLKFPLTAKPAMFLQLLVDNLNLHDSGWSIGTCIESTEKYLSFNHESCLAVLNRLCDEFNTEFELSNKQVSLCKIERNKAAPLPLSYGKGNGFKPGTGRSNQGDKFPITILYVQGGERNINSSIYGSNSLLLPKIQQYNHQGRIYQTDASGLYITRADRTLTVYNEDGYDATHIYPSRVGTVSSVIAVDVPNHFYDIKDSSIPEALDYSQCRIAGEKATIIFQSGILAGKEFDLEQTDSALTGYVHAERRFKIVPQEVDGQVMPNATFKPAIGDKYAIFNISLPESYICDNVSQSGASWEMLKESCKYLYENEDEAFTFSGELDALWSKKQWLEIGGKILPGGYVNFSDAQFQPNGVLIRITGIKDYINNPYSPELELSNTPVAGYVSSDLGKLEAEEVKNDNKYKDSLSFTKRRWRDAKETLLMLELAIEGFSGAINPITIQTMAMLVGDESLQFRFVSNLSTPTETLPNFAYDQTTKIFTAPQTYLQHMTLGITKTSSSHDKSEYKYWTMSSYASAPITDEPALYFYAKCVKGGSMGTFLFSAAPYKMDPGDGYYYFLVGALSSEYDGERSFVTVYGFTEILPGRITTSLIISPDGNTYFNVAEGKIGGKITFGAGSSGYDNISDRPNLTPLYNGVNGALDAAEEASNAANTANTNATNATNTANSKAKVFYQTTAPTSGMRTNDLWVDGLNIYRYSGSSWVLASAYDQTITQINGGLITTGAIAFGSTGGMAASGTIRIWSGGTASANGQPPTDPTFKVLSSGAVYGSNSIICRNSNGDEVCGFSSYGTDSGNVIGDGSLGSTRIWAGASASTKESAPFRVGQSGIIQCPAIRINNGNMLILPTGIHMRDGGAVQLNGNGQRQCIISAFDSGSDPLIKLSDLNNIPYTPLPLLSILSKYSSSLSRPGVLIDAKSNAWGSAFRVESRYYGEAESMQRTTINVGYMPTLAHLKQISSNAGTGGTYTVKLDWNTQYLYIE